MLKMVEESKSAKTVKLETLANAASGGVVAEKDDSQIPFYTSYMAIQDLAKKGLLRKAPNNLYVCTDKGKEIFDDILKYAFELIK